LCMRFSIIKISQGYSSSPLVAILKTTIFNFPKELKLVCRINFSEVISMWYRYRRIADVAERGGRILYCSGNRWCTGIFPPRFKTMYRNSSRKKRLHYIHLGEGNRRVEAPIHLLEERDKPILTSSTDPPGCRARDRRKKVDLSALILLLEILSCHFYLFFLMFLFQKEVSNKILYEYRYCIQALF
jgi:hypothetical protein